MPVEPVEIRSAGRADIALLRELWEEFELEVPDPVGEQPDWSDVATEAVLGVDAGFVLLAEGDGWTAGLPGRLHR